jgi:hypothetical protein
MCLALVALSLDQEKDKIVAVDRIVIPNCEIVAKKKKSWKATILQLIHTKHEIEGDGESCRAPLMSFLSNLLF